MLCLSCKTTRALWEAPVCVQHQCIKNRFNDPSVIEVKRERKAVTEMALSAAALYGCECRIHTRNSVSARDADVIVVVTRG